MTFILIFIPQSVYSKPSKIWLESRTLCSKPPEFWLGNTNKNKMENKNKAAKPDQKIPEFDVFGGRSSAKMKVLGIMV